MRRKLLVLFMMLCVFNSLNGQKQGVLSFMDSLLETGSTQQEIFEEIFAKSMNYIGRADMNGSINLYDTAVIFALSHDDYNTAAHYLLCKSELYNMTERTEDALKAIEPIANWTLPDSTSIQYLINKGSLLSATEDPVKGEMDMLKALSKMQENDIWIFVHVVYFELGNMAWTKGEYVNAIDWLLKAIKASEEPDLIYHKVKSIQRLASLFSAIGNIEKAIYYNNWGIDLSIENEMPISLSKGYEMKGILFERLQKLDSAEYFYYQALEASDQTKIPRAFISVRARLANLHVSRGNLDSAEMFFPTPEQMNSVSDDYNTSIMIKHSLANFQRAKGELWEATISIQEVLDMAAGSNRPLFYLYGLRTAALLAQDRNDKESYKVYLKQIQELEDSLFQIRQSHEIHNKESDFSTGLKDEEIKDLSEANEKRRQQLRLYGGIAVSLAIIAGLFFFLLRANRRKSKLLQEKNETITAVLGEKEVLLKEIHHRVKNNLQIVSSMLKMQSRGLDDPIALEALKDSQNRVQSMAIIHQDLYQEDDLSGIFMPDYIDKITKNIMSSYKMNSNVILQKKIEDIKLDIDTVIPLGLILNELITNSIKHAFDEGQDGIIDIQLFESEETLHLVVSDNGSGEGITTKDSGGFGRKMIAALSAKLKAEHLISHEGGFKNHFIIESYNKVQ